MLSIHQNTYPGSRYHGAHVFYAPTEGSQELAEHVQNSIKAALQPDNERAVKRIPDTVYIMNHVTCPAVLIECGFLTNPEEEALLRDEDYQRKLSAVRSVGHIDVSPSIFNTLNSMEMKLPSRERYMSRPLRPRTKPLRNRAE